MKRWLSIAFLALAVAAGAQAAETCSKTDDRTHGDLPSCVAVDAVTTDTISSTVDTFGYKLIRAQVWSATTSVATITLEARSSENAPWFVIATITDPVGADANGVAGEYWALPRAYQYRMRVVRTGGTISGTFERYNE